MTDTTRPPTESERRRAERHAAIRALSAAGFNNVAISRLLNISRMTVIRVLSEE